MMSRGSTPAFVGRVPELSTLIDAFEAARAGRATTALVGGEAGVGKSRLVRELGAHARRSGARVLVGHCLDLEEGGLPYAPFVDILRTLERELPADEGRATIGPLRAALGSPPGDASPESPGSAAAAADPFGRARVFEKLLTLLDRLTASGPVVPVIEDIHWADRSTDDLITLLSTGARHLPLLLAATYRTDDGARRGRLQDLLAELTRRGVTQVRLRRLDRGEVVELASALLGGPPSAELAAGIVDRSDGNPLFVEELVAAVADDPAAPMPPHLRDAVLSRVRRMPPNAAATLRACAVGGRQVEHDLLAGYARYRAAEATLAAGGHRDGVAAELGRCRDVATTLRARPLSAAIERLARRARLDLGVDLGVDLGGPGGGPGLGIADVSRRGDGTGAGLTPREAEVLVLVAEGLTNRQIGQRLFISEKTASVHVSRLMAKLGAGPGERPPPSPAGGACSATEVPYRRE
jgi:DNA-binding CsgD family transcriptional regulator